MLRCPNIKDNTVKKYGYKIVLLKLLREKNNRVSEKKNEQRGPATEEPFRKGQDCKKRIYVVAIYVAIAPIHRKLHWQLTGNNDFKRKYLYKFGIHQWYWSLVKSFIVVWLYAVRFDVIIPFIP